MSIEVRPEPEGSLRPPAPMEPEPTSVKDSLTLVADSAPTDSITEIVAHPAPAVGINSEFAMPLDETISVPEEDISGIFQEEEPRFTVIPRPEFELEDLPPAFQEAVDFNVAAARRMYITRPDSIGGYVDRHMLKKMAAIPEKPPAQRLSVSGGTPGLSPESTGMTEANFQYWMEHDQPYLTRRMEERNILAKSGVDGYATTKLTAGELRRKDAQAIAEAEAIILGQYTDGIDGMIGRAAYDLRAGFGNVAAFGIGGAEGIIRAIADFNGGGEKNAAWRDLTGYAAALREAKLDVESEMVGAEIDTGSPVLDYIRSGVFRGTPMMGAFAAAALIPGVGAGGAAGIMATGMGADTYSTLRDDGIDPVIALFASAATGAASYFSTKFQLDNLVRYYRGRSPFGMFSVGTLRDVTGEVGQEVVENTAKTTAEGLARLIGDKEYTADKFWNDLKTGFLQSLDEGASVGITTTAMRLMGLPIAARNQMRATAFGRSAAKVGASISKTEMFKENPAGLAENLTNMAWKHGDGNVYATIESLKQVGVTKEKAVAPVEEGGLGLSAEKYDGAAATEGVLPVGFGQAIVFGAKEAEAGNTAAAGAFMVNAEAMSVGDIARQRADAVAVITQAESYFKEEVAGDSRGTSLRIRMFKAGLRAYGFDVNQAAAVTAVYRAGAARSAELAGETVEEWLERKNVRLQFEKSLLGAGNGSAARYENLLRELDGDPSEQAGGEAAVPEAIMTEAQAGTEAPVEVLTQPAVGDGDNRAWIDEATANIVNSLGLQGEAFAPLSAEIRAAVEQGIDASDVREMAGRLGIALPDAAAAEQELQASIPVPVSEKRAKFDAAPTLVATTEGVIGVPDGAGFSGRLVEWARSRGILGTFENTDTGWSDINVTATSIRDVNSHKAARGKLAVLEVLPDLIRSGIYLETTQRNEQQVSHVFAGKTSIDGVDYTVGFVVNEDQNGKRYYNHELTEIKKTPGALWDSALDATGSATNRESTVNRADTKSPTPLREPISSIVRRHLFVNPDAPILESLYQESAAPATNPGVWARTDTYRDKIVINIFKGANVSSIMHELVGHVFVNDLIEIVKAGHGGDRARAQLDSLNAFAGGNLLSDDPEARVASKEKIARAWEMYFMTAEAPAPNLEDAFATIRRYIAAVYRNVRNNPLVEPSPEARRVFDTMLATDRQIADAADIRSKNADWTKAGGVSAEIQSRMNAINERRDAGTRKRRDAARGAGRATRNESMLDARRRVMRGELSQYPVYRAIDLAKAHGGIDRSAAAALIGETAVAEIIIQHGAAVFNETGNASYTAERAAKAAGFVDSVAMFNAMHGAQAIDVRAERSARTDQEITDLAEDIFGDAEEEEEGADDETASPASVAADMTGTDEEDADERDMKEEVVLALENEGVGARVTEDRLRDWRNDAAALKRAAYKKVFSMSLREAVNITAFRSAREAARRKAFTAQGRGDKARVTALKKEELYHFYEIQAAKKARALRSRITTEYTAGGLRSTINAVAPETAKIRELIDSGYKDEQLRMAMSAAEHNAKVEYEYARVLAEMALYAGFGESRFLKELAGDRAGSKMLTLPTESEELGGLVGNIADTIELWMEEKRRPANFTDFRDFTVDQLVEIDRVMRWLIDNGRGKLAHILDTDIENLKQLMQKSVEPMLRRKNRAADMDGNDRTKTGNLRNKIGKFIIGLTIPENWFMAMDGNPTLSGGAAGVNQRLIFETMIAADVEKDRLYSDIVGKMKPAFETFEEMKKRLEKRFGGRLFSVAGLPVPEILKRGRNIASWDADMLLAIALHMGNDANMRRLLTDADFEARFGFKVTSEDGQDMSEPRYNFTNAQIDIVAGLFTDAEWDAVQSVWDAIDSLYAQSDAVTFALTNRHVRKEQATAFTVRETADGNSKTVRGGYFPLINDPRLSDRAAQLQEGQSIEEYIQTGSIASVYGSTKQSVGAIKSRARNEEGVPMSALPQILDTNVIVRHIDAMTHYIAHALPLRDIDRLTRSAEWRDIYVAKFGRDRYDAIRKWVKNLAMPERGDTSAGGRFAEKLRSLATVNALGLRWKTGVKQRLGAFNAAAFMGDAAGSQLTGWKYLKQGVWRMGLRGGLGFANAAFEEANRKSIYMLARDGSFDREMRAMQGKISPLSREFLGKTPGEWQNMMFFWIQANDRAMAYSVWWGAYLQAKAGDAGFSIAAADGESVDETDARCEQEAVAFADRAARTQASSFAADLTENQRDHGIMRFLSMFMSGNVRQGSRMMQYMDAYKMGDKKKADVAMAAAREFAFPALAWVFTAAAVKYALHEAFGFGDDDDYNLLAESAWEVSGTATAPFPLVREIPRMMQYGYLSGDVPAIKSVGRAATQAFGIPGKVAEARYMLAIGDAMRAAGYAFGIPVMNPMDDLFGIRLSEALGLKKKRGER